MKRKIDENHPLSYFLRSAREDMDLTQLDVMRLTGINNKTLSGYENGVAEPDFKSLAMLSKLYNISFDELLNISSDRTAVNLSLSKNEEKLLSLSRRLDSDRQKELLVQLKALTEYLSKK